MAQCKRNFWVTASKIQSLKIEQLSSSVYKRKKIQYKRQAIILEEHAFSGTMCFIYMCMYIYEHALTHTGTHACTHTGTHACTHTHHSSFPFFPFTVTGKSFSWPGSCVWPGIREQCEYFVPESWSRGVFAPPLLLLGNEDSGPLWCKERLTLRESLRSRVPEL